MPRTMLGRQGSVSCDADGHTPRMQICRCQTIWYGHTSRTQQRDRGKGVTSRSAGPNGSGGTICQSIHTHVTYAAADVTSTGGVVKRALENAKDPSAYTCKQMQEIRSVSSKMASKGMMLVRDTTSTRRTQRQGRWG